MFMLMYDTVLQAWYESISEEPQTCVSLGRKVYFKNTNFTTHNIKTLNAKK